MQFLFLVSYRRFGDILSVIEDGINRTSWNVGNLLPTNAAQETKKSETLSVYYLRENNVQAKSQFS